MLMYKIYILWGVNFVTNTKFDQLTVLVVEIRGKGRYITEIIALVNKIHVHMANLCHIYMSDSSNSLR